MKYVYFSYSHTLRKTLYFFSDAYDTGIPYPFVLVPSTAVVPVPVPVRYRYGSTVPVRTSTLAPQRSQPQQDFVPVVYHHPGMYLRYPYTVVVPTLTDTVKSLTTNLHPHRRGQAADAEPECPSTAASWPASTCRLQEEYDVRCRWHLLKY